MADISNKDVFIKLFIKRICTPTTFSQRLSGIKELFKNKIDWTFDEYTKIWKGLFYALWYSEMGKGYEKLISEISSNCDKSSDLTLSGFDTLTREWHGIDYIRIDKFAYLGRYLLRSAFKYELNLVNNENESLLMKIFNVIKKSSGLFLHIIDIYNEELRNLLESTHFDDENSKLNYLTNAFQPYRLLLMANETNLNNEILNGIYNNLEDDLLINEDEIFKNKFYQSLSKDLFENASKQNIKNKNLKQIYGLVRRLRSNKKTKINLQTLRGMYKYSGQRRQFKAKSVKCTKNVTITSVTPISTYYGLIKKTHRKQSSKHLPFKLTITNA